MQLGNFSVYISNGKELEDGYVSLPHNTQYYIDLHNHESRRCAAEITIDGKHVGLFRIGAYGHLRLERPSHDTGRFTFYKDGTDEARKANLDKISTQDRGVISVTFKPEKWSVTQEVEQVQTYPWRTKSFRPTLDSFGDNVIEKGFDGCIGSSEIQSSNQPLSFMPEPKLRKGPSGSSVSSGGTGLSGQSTQTFRTVGHLDYDESSFVTINLRLVAREDGPRELTVSPVRSNPVPQPV